MDVFLSYSAKDQELADTLAADIGHAGLTCFLAPKSIRAGEPWADRIRAELQSCRCLVVLLSPNSIQSEWVTTEWGAAWALGKHIIPVLFRCEPKAIPPRLASLQVCDYHRFGSVIGEIIETLSFRVTPGAHAATGVAPQQVVLSADDIQPAFQEICREAEERIRLFLHVLGPPKITGELAEQIAKRVAARKGRPRPLRFSPVLALNLDRTPDWFWPTFDERDKIYARYGILELTVSRFFHTHRPTGIDVVVVDRRYLMFMVTNVEGAAGTQTGLLFRDNSALAAEYADWFDGMIWANARSREDARAGRQ